MSIIVLSEDFTNLAWLTYGSCSFSHWLK